MDTTIVIKTKKDIKVRARALTKDRIESLETYRNKKEIIAAYKKSLKE